MACLPAHMCLCRGDFAGSGHETVYEASVTGVSSTEVTFTVTSAHGAPDPGGTPPTITRQWNGELLGQHYLVFADGWRTIIHRGDVIECSNLTIPLEDAVEIALADECRDQLVSMGFVEPECNDYSTGCAVGSGPSGWLLPFLLLAAHHARRVHARRAPRRRHAP